MSRVPHSQGDAPLGSSPAEGPALPAPAALPVPSPCPGLSLGSVPREASGMPELELPAVGRNRHGSPGSSPNSLVTAVLL